MLHLFASSTSLSWYWLWHPLQGPGYQFWSGVASDAGEITLLAGAVGIYKHINCEYLRCPRPGHRHPDHGRPVCRKHYHCDVVPPRESVGSNHV